MGVWALVLVLIVWLLVREPRHDEHDDPGAILRARFARGEITEDEFRRASDALWTDSQATSSGVSRALPREHRSGQEPRHD